MTGHRALLQLFLLAGNVIITMAESSSPAIVQPPNAARYDNYRLYRLQLETDEHVQVFQQVEAISDSVIFYGHARNPGQHLTIMVAAHKIADITELLTRYNVQHRILVRLIMMTYCICILSSRFSWFPRRTTSRNQSISSSSLCCQKTRPAAIWIGITISIWTQFTIG